MSTPSTSTFPDTLWAGTEHSLLLAVEAHNKVMAGLLNGSRDDDEEDDERPAFAVLMHIPSDQPERGQAVTMVSAPWPAALSLTARLLLRAAAGSSSAI